MTFAATPKPPYHAVIFSSRRTAADDAGYGAMSMRMDDMAKTMPGYLGVESARDADGFGITVSYWVDEHANLGWKQHAVHLLAQAAGRTRWYEHYELRVAKVERAYNGPEGRLSTT